MSSCLRSGLLMMTPVLAALTEKNSAEAAEFHVSPTGVSSGDGSVLNPWDIVTAFGHPASVQPGDTLWLHGGTYAITGTLYGRLVGTAQAPIVVRQAAGEGATLDTGNSPNNRILIDGAYTWYWGFEVTSTAADRWADDGVAADRGYSIDVANNADSPGIKLINLVVHDTQGAIGFWRGALDGEIYGCLIYYNGFDYTDRGHGHGIYTQNEMGTKRLVDNIIFGQYSHGVHAYTEGGLIDNFYIEGTIGFENGVVSTVSGRTRNILIGGTPVAQNPELVANYTYFDPANGEGTSSDLGYGAGTTNAIARDNVFVGGGTSFRLASPSATVTGNTFYGPVDGVDAMTFPDNAYHLAAPPTGVMSFVRPNQYEPDRAHVVIFNWDGLDAVSVDLSTALTPGDSFELRDVQNYFGTAILSETYGGGSVSVPMTSTEVAPVVGTPATAYVHTSKAFGAFVLLRTRTGQGGSSGMDAGASASGSGGAGGMSTDSGNAGAPAGSADAAAGGGGDDSTDAGRSSGARSADEGGCGCVVPSAPSSRGPASNAALCALFGLVMRRRLSAARCASRRPSKDR